MVDKIEGDSYHLFGTGFFLLLGHWLARGYPVWSMVPTVLAEWVMSHQPARQINVQFMLILKFL